MNFGLETFPFTDQQCGGGDILIEVGPENAGEIAAVVGGGPDDVGTAIGTPTAEALVTAKTYLDSLDDGLNKYVLLANDGAPNCNDSLDNTTCRCSVRQGGGNCGQAWWCLDDEATAAAASDLNAAGYPVYVMGMGGSMEWEDVMNAIAEAGGTGSYIPADEADFAAVLTELVGGLVSCEFDVDWASLADNADPDPSKVNFYCKQDASEPNDDDPTVGNILPFDDDCTNGVGWTWTGADHEAVRMCGDTCDRIKAGECPVLTATFGCASVVIL